MLFTSVWWWCSSLSPGCMSGSARRCEVLTMGDIIVGMIALLLFVYLLVAMVRPEKF